MQVCRLVKAVDITPMLAVLPDCKFVAANTGSKEPGKSPCFVVVPGSEPASVRAFVKGLELGGETKRIVIRKLGPRQGMAPHTDRWMGEEADWRRFQVPLVTDPSVLMCWPEDGVEVHLKAGWLYEVRFDRTHEVVNGWDGERIHLQIDQVGATI